MKNMPTVLLKGLCCLTGFVVMTAQASFDFLAGVAAFQAAIHDCSAGTDPQNCSTTLQTGDTGCIGFNNLTTTSKSVTINFKNAQNQTFSINKVVPMPSTSGNIVKEGTPSGINATHTTNGAQACFSWNNSQYVYQSVTGSNRITGVNCLSAGGPKLNSYAVFWITWAGCAP